MHFSAMFLLVCFTEDCRKPPVLWKPIPKCIFHYIYMAAKTSDILYFLLHRILFLSNSCNFRFRTFLNLNATGFSLYRTRLYMLSIIDQGYGILHLIVAKLFHIAFWEAFLYKNFREALQCRCIFINAVFSVYFFLSVSVKPKRILLVIWLLLLIACCPMQW